MSKNCAQNNISKRLDKTTRAAYSTRCVYNTDFVEKYLFNQLYVRNLLSIYRSTSPSTLYSDIVKIPSKHRVKSIWGLNPSKADKIQSKIVKCCNKSNVNMQNKVSINDVRSSSVSSKNNIETSEQKHVGFNKVSHTGVVIVWFPPTLLCNIGSGIAHHFEYCASVVTA